MSKTLKIIGGIFFALAALAVVWTLSGCAQRITGGQHRESAGGVTITVEPQRVSVSDNRTLTMTTQPSFEGPASQKINLASTPELGGISVEQVMAKFQKAWPLGLIFIAAGVGLYYLGQPLSAVVCGALGVLVILVPQYVAIGLGVLVALVVWRFIAAQQSNKTTTAQIVAGVDNALAKADPIVAREVKDRISEKMDASAKAVVAKIKGAK